MKLPDTPIQIKYAAQFSGGHILIIYQYTDTGEWDIRFFPSLEALHDWAPSLLSYLQSSAGQSARMPEYTIDEGIDRYQALTAWCDYHRITPFQWARAMLLFMTGPEYIEMRSHEEE